jgi:hypothetical protein
MSYTTTTNTVFIQQQGLVEEMFLHACLPLTKYMQLLQHHLYKVRMSINNFQQQLCSLFTEYVCYQHSCVFRLTANSSLIPLSSSEYIFHRKYSSYIIPAHTAVSWSPYYTAPFSYEIMTITQKIYIHSTQTISYYTKVILI